MYGKKNETGKPRLHRSRSRGVRAKVRKRKGITEMQASTAFTMLWAMANELGIVKSATNDVGKVIWNQATGYALSVGQSVWWKAFKIIGLSPVVEDEENPIIPNALSLDDRGVSRDQLATDLSITKRFPGQWYSPVRRKLSRTCISCGHTEDLAVGTIAGLSQTDGIFNISAASIVALGASYIIWRKRERLHSWLGKRRTANFTSISRRSSGLSLQKSGRLTSVYV